MKLVELHRIIRLRTDLAGKGLFLAAAFALIFNTQISFAEETKAQETKPQVSLRADPAKAPWEFQDVGIDEHLGAQLDFTKLNFRNENGELISLQSAFDGKRPVILSMVYFECPMLCTLVLNGLLEGMELLDLKMGKDFKVVSVSFDPKDTPSMALQKRDVHLEKYGKATTPDAWSFLTGDTAAIQDLAKQVGFAYKYVGGTDRFSHPAVLFVLTPDGKLSRYLYGAKYQMRDLRFSMIEASQGKIGNVIDRFLMFCYHYEPNARGYVVSAIRLMQVSGVMTVLFLFIFIGGFWISQRSEIRKNRKEKQA